MNRERNSDRYARGGQITSRANATGSGVNITITEGVSPNATAG